MLVSNRVADAAARIHRQAHLAKAAIVAHIAGPGTMVPAREPKALEREGQRREREMDPAA